MANPLHDWLQGGEGAFPGGLLSLILLSLVLFSLVLVSLKTQDHLEDEGATQRAPPDDEKRLNLRAPAARDLLQKYLISSWCLYIFPAPKKKSSFEGCYASSIN